jgi:hypothetical protein
MLNADFEQAGVAAARGASGWYWCAVFGRSSSPPVRSDGAAGDERSSSGGTSPRQLKDREPGPSAGQAWRYRWHEGRWWYWLPSQEWAVWIDGQWMKVR